MSKIFSKPALKALNRIGDIMIPENSPFPSYSQTGCIEHVDILIAHAPLEDIKDLNLLLSILSLVPAFVLRWFVKQMSIAHKKEGSMAVVFRQLDFGLRGIILGTYYSSKTGMGYSGINTHEIIGFSINRIEE
jgi:hypothetical protein